MNSLGVFSRPSQSWLLILFLIRGEGARALIKGPPEVSSDYLSRYVAKEGDTVKMVCPIQGLPKPIIEWYQDDRLIGSHAYDRFRSTRRVLKIRGVRTGDSGVFVCKGVNGFGSEQVELNLVVRDLKEVFSATKSPKSAPPRAALFEDERSHLEPTLVKRTPLVGSAIHKEAGQTLRLECFVDGSPTPTIVWYKDDDILMTPNLETERTQTTLVIPDLDPAEDQGLYRCKARNVWGEVNATFPVKIHDKFLEPVISGPARENLTLDVGDSVYLSCEVTSKDARGTRTQVQWLRRLPEGSKRRNNKTVVVDVSDYVFEIVPTTYFVSGPAGFYNASLRVEHPDLLRNHELEKDFDQVGGLYICMANNKQGHAHKEVFLKVNRHQNGPLVSVPSSSLVLVPVVSVAVVAVTLACILILVLAPAIRKAGTTCCGSKFIKGATSGENKGSPSLHVNPMSSVASPYATSFVGDNGSYLKQGSYTEVAKKEDEQWVEVTNKANQTPSHWVYSDMVEPASASTCFGGGQQAAASVSASAVATSCSSYVERDMDDYDSPTPQYKNLSSPVLLPASPFLTGRPHKGSPFRDSGIQSAVNSPLLLRNKSLMRANSQPVCSPQLVHSSPSRILQGKLFYGSNANQQHLYQNARQMVFSSSTSSPVRDDPGNPRFPPGQFIYANPPSEHFYFKIKDGKTEFI